ncbi:toll/interleukin-1 receptor domain-containing protein [Calothrix sp. PCC 7507]|uniref:toll/interleukin-1 receptor domain-containing protein n=1 Tax=Calothrix sp. PCC 7507 TaxID=99598 RepID=UPI00029F2A43|nr:toll/interleukin-1 receptor domain-containing protein [Calothrix sp. PCC 7507]AFY35567.1 hypothetical protein Cal7507_5226 [Calothrix sp. PCC 7507]
MPATKSIEVLYCCSDSNKDEQMRQELEKHLSFLAREGVITGWHKDMISPGKDWESEIDNHIKSADIILVLISSDFIASDYHWDVFAKQAMERHRTKTARVIAILLRPVDDYWKVAFPKVKILPSGEKPVTEWKPYDKAFRNITKGIREVAEEITDSNFPIKKSLRQIWTAIILISKFAVNACIYVLGVGFSSLFRTSKFRRRHKISRIPVRIVLSIVSVTVLMHLIPQLLDLSGITSSKTKKTLKSSQKVNHTGWIWLGMVNNTSGGLSVGKRLIKPSNTDLSPSIDPPIVPSPGAVVTVKYKVNLRKEKFLLTEPLVELQPGEKLIIIKVEPLEKASQSSANIKLRAQVRKCNQTCNR